MANLSKGKYIYLSRIHQKAPAQEAVSKNLQNTKCMCVYINVGLEKLARICYRHSSSQFQAAFWKLRLCDTFL